MSSQESEGQPQMSTTATLIRSFYEPGAVFANLNRRPRFIAALLIVIACVTVMNFVIVNKVGFERVLREQLDRSPATQQLTAEQKEKIVQQQSGTAMTVFRTVSAPLILAILTVLGALYYVLGCNALGGSATFSKGLAVWAYASLPPTVILAVANIVVAAFKSADDIDVSRLQNGLFRANPTMFLEIDGALGALVASFDAFAVWGWILAAIGLSRLCKLSIASACGVVGLLALFSLAFKVVVAALFG